MLIWEMSSFCAKLENYHLKQKWMATKLKAGLSHGKVV